jgi:hypothetical protein
MIRLMDTIISGAEIDCSKPQPAAKSLQASRHLGTPAITTYLKIARTISLPAKIQITAASAM